MQQLARDYSDPKELALVPLQDMAMQLLRLLIHRERTHGGQPVCLQNITGEMREIYRERMAPGCLQPVAEAWAWLLSNGFLCQHADHDHTWKTPTRAGRSLASQEGYAEWLDEQQLPAHMLHAGLHGMALRLFRQAHYDTAVFEGFKCLELAIRHAAGLDDSFIGIKLAARAFHPEGGPLTNSEAETGERVSLMNLMSGALGSYKNPQSHRHVGLGADEAREALIIASHLLKIVDSRTPMKMS